MNTTDTINDQVHHLSLVTENEIAKMLPKKITVHPPVRHFFKHGCYHISFEPAGRLKIKMEGSIRYDTLEKNEKINNEDSQIVKVSGDLYMNPPVREEEPDFPIFPEDQYAYYFRVLKLVEETFEGPTNGLKMTIEVWNFHKTSATWKSGPEWDPRGKYDCILKSMEKGVNGETWEVYDNDDPEIPDSAEGQKSAEDPETHNTQNKQMIGTAVIKHKSYRLRKAFIEIDKCSETGTLLNNSDENENDNESIGWAYVGKSIDWDIDCYEREFSASELPEVMPEKWSGDDAHDHLNRWRQTDLNRYWCYHILVVPKMSADAYGFMYDGAFDSNNVPREGCMVHAHIEPSNYWPKKYRNKPFYKFQKVYFRTAVHEVGHLMGLYHCYGDCSYMNPTINIIEDKGDDFEKHIKWGFSENDIIKLKHWPDIYIRPGGTPFDVSRDCEDALLNDTNGLKLNLKPILKKFPLGAPVRINIELKKTGLFSGPVPKRLNLKTGMIRGSVIRTHDAEGNSIKDTKKISNIFPLLHYEWDCLTDGNSDWDIISDSLTLLRGDNGALFPKPGEYTVMIELKWSKGQNFYKIPGDCTITILPGTGNGNIIANELLNNQDLGLVLILSRSKLIHGIKGIKQVLKGDDETLKPHYRFLEAKRLLSRPNANGIELGLAADYFEKEIALTPAEIERTLKLLKELKNKETQDKNISRIVEILRDKAKSLVKEDFEIGKIIPKLLVELKPAVSDYK